MKSCIICVLILIISVNNLISQSNPVWNIGTKWTYELVNPPGYVSYVTNEIVDTVTLDNLKLYEVLSEPVNTGIRYFHFDNSKVYNYDPGTKILQLLYDFSETSNYQTEYRPICDPSFDYDSLISQSYVIEIDSIETYQLPNGQNTTIQYTNNEVTRRVIKNIGFIEGYIHHTHDWEFGVYICDELANFATKLRCFENDTVSYNFQTYPCDSTWLTTQINEISESKVKIFPNPTQSNVQIGELIGEIEYELFSIFGQKINEGKTINGIIELGDPGPYLIRMRIGDKKVVYKVIKIE